ncbi:ATP-binding protein [Fulvivirga sp. M361]|uniref:AAA family ATPase n=1 Tax=Fulvivirga sp. M361 TaxID=2594266 RepID=UPI00117B666C|nr:ATP-binding protein [Fulvivirga sp. M361]TRX61258.1 ATP-binding protein [Fulvivirga sp. M361]
MKKVVVIGPECSGKTTLSSSLATYYNTTWVPEYARYYIDRLDRPYNEADLLPIAKGQLLSEDQWTKKADRIVICDTNLLVIKIWQEYKYGDCYPKVLEMIKGRTYDLYLLTHVDIPWKEDPQRENPHLRDFFFHLFKKELEEKGLPFIEIKGEFHSRKKTAIDAIDNLLAGR